MADKAEFPTAAGQVSVAFPLGARAGHWQGEISHKSR
jgi:hypothetical protein